MVFGAGAGDNSLHRPKVQIMSKRFNNGSHYENHQRAAELHDQAAHAHRAAGPNGKGDHLTAHELSRRAHEYSTKVHGEIHAAGVGHGTEAFGHQDVAARAHELWQARGCPDGSSLDDWFNATEELRTRSVAGLPVGPV